MTAYFVSGHLGALEWADRQGIHATQVAHLDVTLISVGDVVIGTLPVHLAAAVCERSARYLHLVMDLPQEARQKNLSANDMERFNARIEEFNVSRVTERNNDA